LEEVTEEELGRVLPERLVQRIKGRIKEEKENQEAKKPKVKANDSNTETESEHPTLIMVTTAKELKTETGELKLETILEIDPHRPDRIIFEGKEIEVTAIEFSLLYLLAQHNSQVMSYDTLLDELWKDEDAIYTRIIQHIYKFRRDILDKIGNNKTNKEKVKNIFKVVSGRGVMLNINDQELKIN
jgi:helicase